MKTIWTILFSVILAISTALKNDDSSSLYQGNWAILVYRPNCQFSNPVKEVWESIIANTRSAHESITYAHISSSETILLTILEVKTLPSIKYITDGRVYTFEQRIDIQAIEEFLKDPIKKSKAHNYLPSSYSIWAKYQYDWYFWFLDWEEKLAFLISNKYQQIFNDIATLFANDDSEL